jgi:hypothetical protein
MTWYPEAFTSISMNDMNMRADPSRGYPGRTYRFYTGKSLYGFGQGLSYTKFTYKFLSVPNKISLSGSLKASSSKNILHQAGHGPDLIHIDEVESCYSLRFYVQVSVTNLGDMDGSHVVMLFARVPKVLKGTPEKQLVGFDRVHTISYGSTETSILLDPCQHLSFANEYGKMIIPLGDHILMLGDLEHVISIQTD